MNNIQFILFLLFLAVSTTLKAKVVTYAPTENINDTNRFIQESDQYSVHVLENGKSTPCFTYKMNAMQYTNRVQSTSWAQFNCKNRVTVRINKLRGKVDYCKVLPSSKNISVDVHDNYVEFVLDQPGQYAVDFQQGIAIDHPMLIFFDPPETYIPDKNDPDVIWFGPGVHNLGDNYRIESGKTIYIEGGAYVKARFISDNAKNINIYGRGILSGEDFPVRSTGFLVHLRNTNNIVINGITIIHAPSHNIVTSGYNHLAQWVKVMGWWFSTDGIHLGDNSCVEDCFTKVNDDAIRLYGSNSLAQRCVIWQMENGAPFQMGWGGNRENTIARDIDIIRVEHYYDNENESVFCAIIGTGGHNHQLLYDNIRIENCDWRIFRIVTMPNRWANWDPHSGTISNIIYKDITVYGAQKLRNIIKGHDEQHMVSDITIENLKIDDQYVHNASEGNFFIDPKTTKNIKFVVDKKN